MERAVFDRMAELDERHWWYRARRDILAEVIERRIPLPADARILEVGCGTGHNLAMLGRFGQVEGVELDAPARALAERRSGRPILDSRLPELLGVEADTYDLIAALDVIEHVDEDRASLAGIASKLKPEGRILITVPMHPWMWTAHDVVHHHKRRYTAKALRRAIEDAGLNVDLLSPFNSLLFPLAAAARLAGKATGKQSSDDALPPAPVNKLFETIFGLERHLVGRVPLPTGVSLLAIASRRPSV
jgi:SAM-dependent methyltransferase